ncbi:MAG: ribonuclease P protein component [Candidatus Blackburnbacteria bacterium RIFCSPHIGHO2_01_FULL_43_15b]|uniref:Ribonuclease P protein component n=1 Tax=Candidatus Blackburnbacteria bacterium RIFCSPHIGHO2_01_FULL_43_15b TaxID=1797513 RepID=A0A1G1UYE8_9BACT|nr:MAG: ribonuclease P protein component [Candidatus Blackburnbacteria bacterium RIFCSPHIGHO2_01_FULL_43_15b]
MLPHQHRLTSKNDFDQVFSKGKNIRGKFFNVIILSNGSSKKSRFGVIVSNKVSKSAVVRNMIKRAIRSFVQDQIAGFERGLDVVVVAKNSASSQDKLALFEDLKSCFNLVSLV